MGKQDEFQDAVRKAEQVDQLHESTDSKRLNRLEEELMETSRADLFKTVITPTWSKEDNVDVATSRGSINPYTKDLRTANLTSSQGYYIHMAMDVMNLAASLKASGSVGLLTKDIQSLAIISPSIKGMLLKLLSSEYSFRHIDVGGTKKGILTRRDKEE